MAVARFQTAVKLNLDSIGAVASHVTLPTALSIAQMHHFDKEYMTPVVCAS